MTAEIKRIGSASDASSSPMKQQILDHVAAMIDRVSEEYPVYGIAFVLFSGDGTNFRYGGHWLMSDEHATAANLALAGAELAARAINGE